MFFCEAHFCMGNVQTRKRNCNRSINQSICPLLTCKGHTPVTGIPINFFFFEKSDLTLRKIRGKVRKRTSPMERGQAFFLQIPFGSVFFFFPSPWTAPRRPCFGFACLGVLIGDRVGVTHVCDYSRTITLYFSAPAHTLRNTNMSHTPGTSIESLSM